MKKNYLPLALSGLLMCSSLASCQVEKLVSENNRILEDINSQITDYVADSESPDLAEVKKVSFDTFYFGEIISEEIIERRQQWTLIRLTEKISKEAGEPVLRVKEGWYTYASPDIIYLVSSTETDATDDKPGDDGNDEGNEGGVNILSNDLPIGSFTISIMPIQIQRQDLMEQVDVDKLLAHRALNFDGLTFKDKRFEYAELGLGSYRGTLFEGSNLDHAQAVRDRITAENDFKNTRFIQCQMNDMRFENWKIIDTRFENIDLSDARFTNCIISSETSGQVTFSNVNFFSARFVNKDEGYIKNIAQFNTGFLNCRFEGVDMYSSGHFNVNYTNCSFYNGKWHGVVFNNTQAQPSRITGGIFTNMTISSGRYTYMKIGKSGLVYPVFENTRFVNTNFWKSEIDAWFRGGFVIEGFGSNFSEVDFKTSIFENGVFGDTVQAGKMNMKYADFSQCEFRNDVTFINCDLTGAKFPADLTNVTFQDCIGNP
ncbi:pentapeptide repeat-containing protein [Roseivirga sp. BDSF3-8]|uniref:pentapeptide repeat-containing protein n=1 Tax=Roseivirga sp. BDSF3-8 TaxID=3241598 RepID=UPI0035320D7E